MKWKCICERICLAGVTYSDYNKVWRSVKAGAVLQLVGEPYNPHDNYAIRVEYKGTKIGYIPTRTALQTECWRAHREGSKIVAVLVAVNRTNPTWSMFVVQVKRTVLPPARKAGKEIKF